MSPSTPQLHPSHGDLSLVNAEKIRNFLPVDIALASLRRDPHVCPSCHAEGMQLIRRGLRFKCVSCGARGTALKAIALTQRQATDFRVRMIAGSLLLAMSIRRHRSYADLDGRFEDFVALTFGEAERAPDVKAPWCFVANFAAALRRNRHSVSDEVLRQCLSDLVFTTAALTGELSQRGVQS